jgi:hypothetical protein
LDELLNPSSVPVDAYGRITESFDGRGTTRYQYEEHGAQLPNPGRSEPIIAFRFPNGGSVSFEFDPGALDDPNGNRGAWLEIKADDLEGVRAALTRAGLRRLSHPATGTSYFVLRGGQVIGFVRGPSPHEMVDGGQRSADALVRSLERSRSPR